MIVSVGMLKESWDVKNIYAICSLRPMLSELLQEQTLGAACGFRSGGTRTCACSTRSR